MQTRLAASPLRFSPPAQEVSEPGTVAQMIEQAADRFGDREAVRSMGTSLSYRDLLAEARRVTSWLQQAGLQPGDRVAIMLPNVLAYPVCLYGAFLGGYVVVTVNPLYTARELRFQLEDSGARCIVVLEPFARTVAEAIKNLDDVQVVVAAVGDLLGPKKLLVDFVARRLKKAVPAWHIPHHVPLAQALRLGNARPLKPVHVKNGDIAFLQYTGGTTGVAKGAVLLHRNVIAGTRNLAQVLTPPLGSDPETCRIVTLLPLYHAAAMLTQLLAVHPLGGCCILVANPRDVDGLIKTLKRERFAIMPGINTLYRALLDHPAIGSVDFSRCLLFTAGAMATQKSVSDRWQALTGRPIVDSWGLTEAAGGCTINPPNATTFSDSIGRVILGNELSIRDEAGRKVPPGESGEICVRGEQVMAGYWNRPEETANVMTPDGFLRTGDSGWIDAEGFVRLNDRIKDMIVVSGFKVYPNEIEAVLVTHPSIAEAAVVGIPDAASGEGVAASIVARDSSLTESAVLEHCRKYLTAYKCPKQIRFVTELPKSTVGKILRRSVRDQWTTAAAS